MGKQDGRDWFIMGSIAAFNVAIMVYCYKFHTDAAFASGCAAVTADLGLFHWFTQRDDKIPDARE